MKGARVARNVITPSAALEAMSKPDANGQVHVKRTGPKGLLPSTWLSRALRLGYVVCGQLRETTGTLLNVYPAGVVLNAGGVREPRAEGVIPIGYMGQVYLARHRS